MEEAEDAGADLWQQVIVGCHAFIESALTPECTAHCPHGWPVCSGLARRTEKRPGLALLRKILGQLMDEGIIERMPISPLAYVLWGTFFEAGVYIANADDVTTAGRKRPNYWFVYWPDSGFKYLPFIPMYKSIIEHEEEHSRA